MLELGCEGGGASADYCWSCDPAAAVQTLTDETQVCTDSNKPPVPILATLAEWLQGCQCLTTKSVHHFSPEWMNGHELHGF